MHLSIRHKLAFALSLLSLAVCIGIYIGIRDDLNCGFSNFLVQVRIHDAEIMADYIERELFPNSLIEMAPTINDWKEIERFVMEEQEYITRPQPKAKSTRQKSPSTPFTLIDTDKRVIHEGAKMQETWPLVAVNGTGGHIGYIAIQPFTRRNSPAVEVALQQQHRHFVMVIVVALLLSIMVAWPLVFILLHPLKQLSVMVDNIASRDYNSKTNIKSNDELGDLSKTINLLGDKLERHDKIQTEWLSQISHDLRTPIAIMLAEIEAINDGVYPLSSDSIQSIEAEVKRLDRQINDLHELSILKCGEIPVNKQNIDIAHLVATVAQETQTQRGQKSLDFSLTCNGTTIKHSGDINPVRWSVDQEKLYHVFTNLMQNSIHYSDGPGQIHCEIRASEKLTLIWKDSKPGVNDGDLLKIFEPMFQGNKSLNFNVGSTGIGLSIVAAIVKLHGGTVKADNIAKQGLRITVELP
ncbi:MAG: HAMP domain-containing protein [Kordiimonadaceae bacterium]|jgi:two-component system, OmpR family, sensor histidine kinase BaeS|nr:HAMP domain-containing protein [Kordiimonadaceae bacterium]